MKITEFGLFVTSNASRSHILFIGTNETACGLEVGVRNTKHPNSEIRWIKETEPFKRFVEFNRYELDAARFCRKCLKSFDMWYDHERLD